MSLAVTIIGLEKCSNLREGKRTDADNESQVSYVGNTKRRDNKVEHQRQTASQRYRTKQLATQVFKCDSGPKKVETKVKCQGHS